MEEARSHEDTPRHYGYPSSAERLETAPKLGATVTDALEMLKANSLVAERPMPEAANEALDPMGTE